MLLSVLKLFSNPYEDTGVLFQAAELIKLALESDGLEGDNNHDGYVAIFYEQYVIWLASPFVGGGFIDSGAPHNNSNNSNKRQKIEMTPITTPPHNEIALHLTCDMLCHLIRIQAYKMRHFILRNNVFNLVFGLLAGGNSSHMKLNAIRFLKAVLGAKDDFFHRYIVSQNLFGKVFEVLKGTEGKDTLLSSAVLEIFNIVCSR